MDQAGGRRFSSVHRVVRRAGPLALALLVTACATKRDVRDMREDLAQQDATLRALQAQNREIIQALTVTTERLLDVRGEMGHQLDQLSQELIQVSELTSQVQIRLTQLDQQLTRAVREVGEAGLAPGPGTTGDPGGDGDDSFSMAGQFYEIGLEQMNRGNAGTARRAFETVIDSFPADPRAADAQRQIGETYAMEQSWDDALRAFDRVVERYPDSESAPRALYRAGVISQERGNLERARQYFERVISGYPGSDARRLAEEAIGRLNR